MFEKYLFVFALICMPACAQDFPGFAEHVSEADTTPPRVRCVHSADIKHRGASAFLLFSDPWLGYARGRELFLREYTPLDGVFGQTRDVPQPVLEDKITPMIHGAKATSCALCHNTPSRDGGAGPTIQKNGPSGRNTPHLFGAGLIEMIGWQLRLKLLSIADTNRNGFIDKSEAQNVRAVVHSALGEGGADIDFGFFGDRDNDGRPDLNPVCYVWYVDANGKRIPRAESLNSPGVAGYNFEVQVFGWGHANFGARPPISSTLRGFSAAAFHVHSGLQAYDPTLNDEPENDGLCRISLSGAQQFFTGKTLDRGRFFDTRGVSSDDPDHDGVLEELTEGDMDLVEFYQLNHPAPAELERTPQRQHGSDVLNTIGCTLCHVRDWEINAAQPDSADYTQRYPGDRRSFNLAVSFRGKHDRLEGRLESLTRLSAQGQRPAGGSFRVKELYSDFLYHDLGPGFHQTQFNGTVITHFKTAPLWGVGSTAPYGHDGANLDLDSVIRRHAGEAAASSEAYTALNPADREALLAFLRGLVLYSVDELPCDINGDGVIGAQEHLIPEQLMMNKDYGINLEYLRDLNRNAMPDIRE